MSSNFNIDVIRRTGPPLDLALKNIVNRLAKVERDGVTIETDDLVGFSDTARTKVRYDARTCYIKKWTGANTIYTTFEPDYNKLTLDLRFENQGESVYDYSGYNNHALIGGRPCPADGFNHFLYSDLPSPKSKGLKLDGKEDYFEIPHSTSLSVAGLTTGISYFFRLSQPDFLQQNTSNKVIWSKMDDTTGPDNLASIRWSDNGDGTGKLTFFIRDDDNDFAWRTVNSFSPNTTYDIWCTYAVSGNAMKIYVNNVDQTLNSTTLSGEYTSSDAARLFKRVDNGYNNATAMMARVYREKVITAAEVGYMWTNKVTITDVQVGEAAITDCCVLPTPPKGDSFTSTSFTTTSFS